MLVFRRAVSLMLSALLAYTPTLVWARVATPQNLKSKLSTNVQQKIPAKKIGRSKESDDETMTGGEALQHFFPVVHTKSGDVTIIQEPGKGSRAKSQIVHGKDYEEILVDQYGNGTASLWQVTRGNRKFVATNPLNGRFTKLEIEERRAKATIKSRFYWTPATQQYRLSGVEVVPYKRHGYKAPAIANTCKLRSSDSSDLVSNIDGLQAFVTQLEEKTKKHAVDAFACKIRRFQDFYFDESCRKAPFEQSTDALVQGLAKAFASSQADGNGSHFQCVERHGYAIPSARAKSLIINAQNSLEAALKKAGFSKEQISDDKCDRLETFSVNGVQKKISEIAISVPKLINCNSKMSDTAYYEDAIQQVYIGRPAKDVALSSEMTPATPAEAYASIFTHEFLHSGGLPDPEAEDLVKNLQKCCSYPKVASSLIKQSEDACKAVDISAAGTLAAQTLEAVFSGVPAYDQAQRRAEKTFGTDRAHDMITDWEEGFATDPENTKATAQLKACSAEAGTNSVKQSACAEVAVAQFTKYTKNFASGVCPGYTTIRRLSNPAKSCAEVSADFVAVVQSSKESIAISNTPVEISIIGQTSPLVFSGLKVKEINDILSGAPMGPNSVASIQSSGAKSNLLTDALCKSDSGAKTLDQIMRNSSINGLHGALAITQPAVAPVPGFIISSVGTGAGAPNSQSQGPLSAASRTAVVNSDTSVAITTAERPPPGAKTAPLTKAPTGVSKPASTIASSGPRASTIKATPTNSNPTAAFADTGRTQTAALTRTNSASAGTGTDTAAAPAKPTDANSSVAADNSAPSNDGSNTATSALSGPDGSSSPGILSMPTNSPLPMPSFRPPPSLGQTANRTDGISATAGYADTRIGNLLEKGTQSAASMIRDAVVSTANASVADLVRAPAAENLAPVVTSNYSSSPRSIAKANSYASSASLSSSVASSSRPHSRLPADETESPTANSKDKKSSKDKSQEQEPSASPRADTKSKEKSELSDDLSAPATAELAKRAAAVAQSPLGQLYPNGTILDRQLLTASGPSYVALKAKLSNEKSRREWSDLMSARGRQLRLVSGQRLGSPMPVNCWNEDQVGKRFVRVKCGPK